MRILMNGEPRDVDARTIAELLHDRRDVAVARNLAFVPRSAWDTTLLVEHDAIEIVAPMQGG